MSGNKYEKNKQYGEKRRRKTICDICMDYTIKYAGKKYCNDDTTVRKFPKIRKLKETYNFHEME